jgi:hypothetical protein
MRYLVTETVACWVSFTHEVEAESEAAAIEMMKEGNSIDIVDTIGDSIDGYDTIIEVEKA